MSATDAVLPTQRLVLRPDGRVLLVTGAVPGHADGLIFVNTAAKGQPRVKQVQVVRERSKPKV